MKNKPLNCNNKVFNCTQMTKIYCYSTYRFVFILNLKLVKYGKCNVDHSIQYQIYNEFPKIPEMPILF